jgi:hypothetical protein
MEICWFSIVVHPPNDFADTNFNLYTHIYHVQQHHKVNCASHTYNHYASLLCRANNLHALLCHALISTAQSFGCCTITCFMQFLNRTNIPRAFHYTHFTMPKFSMPPLRTNTLRTPLTKLSRDNIYPHCVRTNPNSSALCQYFSHHACYYYVCSYCKMLNLARTLAHQHFSAQCQNLVCTFAHQHFFARHQFLARSPTRQYFSTQCQILTYHRIFTAHHAF